MKLFKELYNQKRLENKFFSEEKQSKRRAVFVTGGPGSGKDIIIRECLSGKNLLEMDSFGIHKILMDKELLIYGSDFRARALCKRENVVITCTADNKQMIASIKEELEELGYDTMMIFVDTSNIVSKQRNESLNRMIKESVRFEKWSKSQENKVFFHEMFENFIYFKNDTIIDYLKEEIKGINKNINTFIAFNKYNDIATDRLAENDKKPNSKNIQVKTVKKYNPGFEKAKGPADASPDNSNKRLRLGQSDEIKGNTFPRKNPNGSPTVTGGAWHGAYEEARPTIKFNKPPKETNFSYDKDKIKRLKKGNSSLTGARVGRPSGVGPEYDTRAGGQGAAAGAGLGQNLYGETQEYSNAQPSSSAMPGSSAMQPNPLSNAYDGKKKEFKKFRTTIKEFNGFQNDVESGVGGVLGGAGNKEGMETYKDNKYKIGIEINKKKKKGAK
jgi:hypothetical protein